jgi:hexosaminidase
MHISKAAVGQIAVTLTLVMSGCGAPPVDHPGGDQIALELEVLDNRLPDGNRFSALLTLTNTSSVPLESNWTLFFNFGKAIAAESLPGDVTATHVNGDYWRIDPTTDFESVAPGESLEIPFEGSGWMTKVSDAPAGPYFVFRDKAGQSLPAEEASPITVAPFQSPRQTDRGLGEKVPVPTPASRYLDYRGLERLPADEVGRVVPTPVVVESGEGTSMLDASWKILHDGDLEGEAKILADTLGQLLGRSPAIAGRDDAATARAIELEIDAVSVAGESKIDGDEAYRLSIDESGIRITGSDAAGVMYGVRTLTALLPVEAWREPQPALALDSVSIEDAPRFSYRGIHLDVSRNFQSVETVKRLIEASSFYKLNRFHFHLTDDEGWRLAIEDLPELVEVGGRRGHTDDELDYLVPSYGSGPDPDGSRGSGHYSRSEMLELLRYATERHVQVIPEVDLPGHARSAIKAMRARAARLSQDGSQEEAEEYLLTDPGDLSEYRSVQGWDDNVVDVCRESTYRFIETVVDEVVAIWAEAEAPLEAVHIGGDEVPQGVWRKSPSCERLIADSDEIDGMEDLGSYFMQRVVDLLTERGLAVAGWEEIALAEKVWDGNHVKEPDPDLVQYGLRPYVWNNVWGWGAEDLGYRLANVGYDVVLCPATNLYFDLAYDRDPLEPGYAWAGFVDTRKAWEFIPFNVFRNASVDLMGNPLSPEDFADRVRLTPEGRSRVLGIQGQLWAENTKSREILEYQAFPKLLGLAERAWAPQPEWATVEDAGERERLQAIDWNEFANRLGQRELPRLDGFLGGVAYRLPPPGAVVEGGVLDARSPFPGLTLQITTDGSSPRADSTVFTGPVDVEGEARVVTSDTRGRLSRVAAPGGS